MPAQDRLWEKTDLEFCRELATSMDPALRLSLLYADPRLRPWIISVRALIAALEQAFSQVRDITVAQAKLAWWLEELCARDPRDSQHPIVRTLLHYGAIDQGLRNGIRSLLALKLQFLDPEVPADELSLLDLAYRQGACVLQLELHGTEPLPGPRSFLGLRAHSMLTGLAQMIRESIRSERLGFWWIPLNLRARYQLEQPISGRDQATNNALASAFADAIRPIQQLVDSQLELEAGSIVSQGISGAKFRHVLAHTAILNRQVDRAVHAGVAEIRKAFRSVKPGDVWHAWLRIRRLQLKESG